jgi:hypothetical protein
MVLMVTVKLVVVSLWMKILLVQVERSVVVVMVFEVNGEVVVD